MDEINAAKVARDQVRAAIVNTLRDLEGLPDELVALLKADAIATRQFEEAIQADKDNRQ